MIIFTLLAIVALSSATTQTELDSESGSKGNYDLTPNDTSTIEAKEQTALRTIREGTELIFATIKEELDLRFAQRFGNGDKRCRVVTDDIEEKLYQIYAITVGTYFDVTSIIRPEANSVIAKIRPLAMDGVRGVVAGMIDGVALIDDYYGDDVRTKIDEIEKKTVENCVNVMRNIYVPILNVQDFSTPIGAKLLLAEEKSVAAIVGSVKGVFRATRSVLTQIFSGVDFGVSDYSSFDAIENSTLAEFHEVVKSVYRAEDILLDAKSEKPEHTDNHP